MRSGFAHPALSTQVRDRLLAMGATDKDRRHFAAIAAAMAKKEQEQIAADARLSVEERLRRGFALSDSALRMRGPALDQRERPPSLVRLARDRRAR